MKRDSLLLKTFFLSFLIHLIGISLFGIVLPFRGPSMKPVEVSLLPPSMSPEDIQLAKIEIIPKMPEIRTTYENLAALKERRTVKFSVETFTGFSEYMPFTQITPRFEFPESRVRFPSVAEFEEEKQPAGMKASDIEGLAGDRNVIYREIISYPAWARMEGMEGNIKIKFWVDPEGRITSTRINVSSGFPELDIHAEENFRKWLFEPVKTDKEVWGIITLRFRLR
jgi:TonB family protein